MEYYKGKIGEIEPTQNTVKKPKIGRPLSEFTEKVAIYITKDMLDYINLASKFEQDRSAYFRRLITRDMEIHKDEYERIFNKGGNA